MKKLVILFAAILIVVSCQKQPTASFTTDKTTYTAGETIQCTNTSSKGKSYVWTMTDGTTYTSANLDLKIPENYGDGTVTIKLKAASGNGNKTNEVTQIVNVVAATGDVMFWSCPSCSGVGDDHVTVNGVVKNITLFYSSIPTDCNTAGCAKFTLKVGSYAFSATDDLFATWNGTFSVTKNGCLKKELL